MKRKILLGLCLVSFSISAAALPPSLPPSKVEIQQPYPVVVLGSGIGALTSALYLARGGVIPVVIEGQSPGGAIAQSHSVQNWPGEVDISGLDLVEKVRKQAELSGVEFRSEEVISVDFSSKPFTIVTKETNGSTAVHTLKASSCIIALGSTPNFLGVPGEKHYFGKGVYSCAVCDGSLYKDQTVAIVGGGDAAISEAHYLSKIAKKVVVIVRKDSFRTVEEKRKAEVLSLPNVEVLFNTTIQEMRGNEEELTHLLVKKGSLEPSLIETNALFLAIGSTPNTSLFQDQLELDEKGYILLKKEQETSIPGVFAIGDIVDPIYKQAISAAGDGAKAALQAERQLPRSEQSLSKETAQKDAPATAKHSHTIEISSSDHFTRELQQATGLVLVDFYAPWCGPCKKLAPEIEAWAKTHKHKVKVLKVNVHALSDLSRYYGVKAMPTALLFNKSGEVIDKKVGAHEIQQLMKQIEKRLASNN